MGGSIGGTLLAPAAYFLPVIEEVLSLRGIYRAGTR
jgi:hypothetical protein